MKLRRNKDQDTTMREIEIPIPASQIADIVREALIQAPTEAHAQVLALSIVLALRAGVEHWTGDHPAPTDDTSAALEDLYGRPAYGEDGWAS